MDIPTIIALTGVIITGALAIWGGARWTGKTDQRLDHTDKRLDHVEKDIKDIKKDVSVLPRLYEKLYGKNVVTSQSPRELTDHGQKLFDESGIKKIIEDNFDSLLAKLVDHKPINAYQAERVLIDEVNDLLENPDYKNQLEKYAFNVGEDVNIFPLVGAIGMRSKFFEKLPFNEDDIDIGDKKRES